MSEFLIVCIKPERLKSKLNCICQENYYGNTLLEVWAKVTEEAKNVHHKLVCSPP